MGMETFLWIAVGLLVIGGGFVLKGLLTTNPTSTEDASEDDDIEIVDDKDEDVPATTDDADKDVPA